MSISSESEETVMKIKNFLKRFKAYALILVVGLGLFTGCGSSGSGKSSGKNAKIYVIFTDEDDAYRKLLYNGLKSSAEKEKVTIKFENCGNDVNNQVEAARKAKKGGYDAIICRLADASTAPQIELAAGGLPVIYVNNQPDESALKADKYIFAASDENQAGKYQAEYVMNKLNKKEMNIVIMEGEKGHSGAEARTASVKENLKDAGVKANVVFMDFANWSDDEAEHKMDLFLRTGHSIDAVFCNNDTMALGVVKSLQSHGLSTKDIPVVGVDATSDGCQSIKDGGMQFTVFQNAKGQAAKAIELARDLGQGKKVDSVKGVTENGKFAWVPFEKVDSSNVDDYMK
jgi:inositol transport system substrate-binding protein